MDHTTSSDSALTLERLEVDLPSVGSGCDGVRTRRWGRHAAWVTLDEDRPETAAVVVAEIDRAGPGATVVVDLADLETIDPARIPSVRASIERAVSRATHVVVVACALDVRQALVSADLDHLTPMPQSRRDAMAFLRSVLQPLSA